MFIGQILIFLAKSPIFADESTISGLPHHPPAFQGTAAWGRTEDLVVPGRPQLQRHRCRVISPFEEGRWVHIPCMKQYETYRICIKYEKHMWNSVQNPSHCLVENGIRPSWMLAIKLIINQLEFLNTAQILFGIDEALIWFNGILVWCSWRKRVDLLDVVAHVLLIW